MSSGRSSYSLNNVVVKPPNGTTQFAVNTDSSLTSSPAVSNITPGHAHVIRSSWTSSVTSSHNGITTKPNGVAHTHLNGNCSSGWSENGPSRANAQDFSTAHGTPEDKPEVLTRNSNSSTVVTSCRHDAKSEPSSTADVYKANGKMSTNGVSSQPRCHRQNGSRHHMTAAGHYISPTSSRRYVSGANGYQTTCGDDTEVTDVELITRSLFYSCLCLYNLIHS